MVRYNNSFTVKCKWICLIYLYLKIALFQTLELQISLVKVSISVIDT